MGKETLNMIPDLLHTLQREIKLKLSFLGSGELGSGLD